MAHDSEPGPEGTGPDLFDLDGRKIGKIEDVRSGEATAGISWLVVDAGFPHGRILVPVSETRRSGGRLSVPFTKQRVADAPKVKQDLELTDADKSKLCRYYGLEYAGSPGAPADECEEMEDQRPGG